MKLAHVRIGLDEANAKIGDWITALEHATPPNPLMRYTGRTRRRWLFWRQYEVVVPADFFGKQSPVLSFWTYKRNLHPRRP